MVFLLSRSPRASHGLFVTRSQRNVLKHKSDHIAPMSDSPMHFHWHWDRIQKPRRGRLSLSELSSHAPCPWNHTASDSLILLGWAHSSLRVLALLLSPPGHSTPKYRWCQPFSHLDFSLNIALQQCLSWPPLCIFFPTRSICLLSFHLHLILRSYRFTCWVVYCLSTALKNVSCMDGGP